MFLREMNHLLVVTRTPSLLIYKMMHSIHLNLSNSKKHPTTIILITYQKNQSKYKDFPKYFFVKSSQSFSSKWYKEFPWVHYHLHNDAAFCYTCMTPEIKGLKTLCHDKDDVFITRGYKNWHHAT